MVEEVGSGAGAIARLVAIMARLRDPVTGCEWDRAQSWETIAPYTLEEAHEVADAIARGDVADLRDELGDLLLQVVFHARIAEEAGAFALADVVAAICDKMERRHPHIFGTGAASPGWEAIKAAERDEKDDRSALAGVALGLPALLRAEKLQKRAARVGFDWPDAAGPRAKIDEELAEVETAPADDVAGEIGDLLFATVNWARHLGIDPEAALRLANRKFERRFRAMEAAAGSLVGLSLDVMETLWSAAKHDERVARPPLPATASAPPASIGPRFAHFACFDWSGAAVARPPGLALAVADRDGPSRLIDRSWSREEACEWLLDVADSGAPWLIGVDLSPTFPFCDAGAYFPGWDRSPPDAPSLWRLVEEICADDPYLGATSFLTHPEAARYFRQHGGRLGDRFGPRGAGRLRVVEERSRVSKQGLSASCFNLVGAAQVGKSSLTGMRVLHRLHGRIPIWPFDPVPASGPVLVEIYTANAARAAGIRGNISKLRSLDDLNAALARLDAPPHPPIARISDHATDAILTAAWLRRVANDPGYWAPHGLDAAIAATEGWTFGVR